MQMLTSLLAQADTDTKKIAEIYDKLHRIPEWAFSLWFLLILIAVAIFALYQRQKKIAQNQVNLANMIEQLLEKEK